MSLGPEPGLTGEDGHRAVELARDAVRTYVSHGRRLNPGSMRDAFYARSGAMVRLETATGLGQLRGCESAPERPSALATEDGQLGEAIVEAAVRAASDVSRGEVRESELPSIKISVFAFHTVSPCTDPESEIEVGGHGLAIEGQDSYAWLYPTVPADQGWTIADSLDRTTRMAGLASGAWLNGDVDVLRLSGQVFEEREPDGSVNQVPGYNR